MLINSLPNPFNEFPTIATKRVGAYTISVLAEQTSNTRGYDYQHPVEFHVTITSSLDYKNIQKYTASYRDGLIEGVNDMPSNVPLAVYEAIHEAFAIIPKFKTGLTLPVDMWMCDLDIIFSDWFERNSEWWSDYESELIGGLMYHAFGDGFVDALGDDYEKACDMALDVIEPILSLRLIEAQVDFVEHFFGNLDMKVNHINGKEIGKDWESWAVHLAPNMNWRKSTDLLCECICGVGYFWFENTQELMDSLPTNSPRQAFIVHSHWIKDYGKVYGSSSPRSYWADLIQSRFENYFLPYGTEHEFSRLMKRHNIELLPLDEDDEEDDG